MIDGAPPLILASRSAARRKMLADAGLAFETADATIDETEVKDALRAEKVSGADAAVALAEMKAWRVASRQAGDVLVLGADQILEVEGRWLDKPGSTAAARAQLLELRGRQHSLYSAAVLFREGTRIWHHVDRAELWVRPFSEAFLDRYMEEADPGIRQSVGAYHLEGLGAQLFSRIRGDFFTILGLPLLPLLQALRDQGVIQK